jgi:hypothetical protein
MYGTIRPDTFHFIRPDTGFIEELLIHGVMHQRLLPCHRKLEDVSADDLFVCETKVFTKGLIVNKVYAFRVLVINGTWYIVDQRLKQVRRPGKNFYEFLQFNHSGSVECTANTVRLLSQKNSHGLQKK